MLKAPSTETSLLSAPGSILYTDIPPWRSSSNYGLAHATRHGSWGWCRRHPATLIILSPIRPVDRLLICYGSIRRRMFSTPAFVEALALWHQDLCSYPATQRAHQWGVWDSYTVRWTSDLRRATSWLYICSLYVHIWPWNIIQSTSCKHFLLVAEQSGPTRGSPFWDEERMGMPEQQRWVDRLLRKSHALVVLTWFVVRTYHTGCATLYTPRLQRAMVSMTST